MAFLLTALILLNTLLTMVAIECPFQPQDDVYTQPGHPAYTVEELEANLDEVFKPGDNSCTPTERVYRSYHSGAVTKTDPTKPAGKSCDQSSECKAMKFSTLQAATCTDLLKIRDEITSGGYTATCRHELTNWNVNPPEKQGCVKNAVCTDLGYSVFLQRRLSPAGLRRASVQGESLQKAGIKIDSLVSSSYERSKNSALQVGHWQGLTEVTEEPLPLDNGVHNPQDYERKVGYKPTTPSERFTDVRAIMRVRLRKWLQEDWEQKTEGGVRYAYSHGGTMKNAFGHGFDEGDCAWSKPTENVYDITEPVKVVLSNKEFPDEMEVGTKRIDLFAVLSPEQTQKMAQCTELRRDMNNDPNLSKKCTILAADTNKNLEVTEEEFNKFCKSSYKITRDCAGLWKTILTLQAKPYWKKDSDTPCFFLGEHAYFNGGWHEKKHSAGGWAFPYRGTTLDTIRPSVSEMKQILAPLDFLLTMSEEEEKAVLNCDPGKKIKEKFASCASSLLKYNPVPTNSRPEDDVYETREYPIVGGMYPYPTTIDITPVPNPVVKLAMCLVKMKHISAKKMLKKMGCA